MVNKMIVVLSAMALIITGVGVASALCRACRVV